jgi:RNA polymerase sigma factor (sigma-70 family)
MAARRQPLLEHVHRLAARLDPEADAVLLQRFARQRDNIAFEALVQRHGPMVLGVCRRVLGNVHDAEDVFQATFLVLARKAAEGRPPDSLPAWLHAVAHRLALKHRQSQKRRQNRETRSAQTAETTPPPDPLDQLTAREMLRVLDEELQRLPESYRLPLLLCWLEGRTQDEAADMLAWTPGSVRGRLHRGRALLYARLARRGLTLGTGLLVAAALGQGISAALPAGLVRATVEASLRFAAGSEAGVAPGVIALAKGAMRMTGLKVVAVLLGLTLAVSAGGVLARQIGAREETEPRPRVEESVQPEPGDKAATRVDRYGDPLPPGALARLGTMRLRHNATIATISLFFTPDGKGLLTAGGDNRPRLWDVTTGKLLRELRAPDFFSVALLSPDGRILAVRNRGIGNSDLYLLEMTTGKPLHKFKSERLAVHDWCVPDFAFSPDSKSIVAQLDGSLEMRDVATGQLLWQKEKRDIIGLAFSPDGKALAAAENKVDGGGVRLWDARTGEPLRELGSKRQARHLAFSPDGRTLAVDYEMGKAHCRSVHLWDAATGKEVRQLGEPDKHIASPVFSPDGKIVATRGEGGIRLWETATGKELRRCQHTHPHWTYVSDPPVFSPDGKVLAAVDGPLVRFWAVDSGKELLSQLPTGHESAVNSVAFTPDGKTLISAGGDHTLRWWDTRTGEQQRCLSCTKNFPWHQGYPKTVLSSDGTMLAAACMYAPDGEGSVAEIVRKEGYGGIRFWDAATGKELHRLDSNNGWAPGLALSPDGKMLAEVFWEGNGFAIKNGASAVVRLWDTASGKRRETKLAGSCPLFSPDGRILATLEGRRNPSESVIYFWDAATGEKIHSISTHEYPYGFITLSPDGKTLAAARNQVSLYPLSWNKLSEVRVGVSRRIPFASQGNVTALAFSPDGRMLASLSGSDPVLRVWETASGKERARFRGPNLAALYPSFTSLAFAADGRRLASGSVDSTILIWDVTGRLQGEQGASAQGERGVSTPRLRPVKLSDKELEVLWTDLESSDAVRAGRAVWTLAAAGPRTVSFLKARLRPAAARVKPEVVARLLADLDADDFPVREKVRRELEQLGEECEPALRQALAKSPSLETRRSLEQLLSQMETARKEPFGEELRGLRAAEVLEQIGTPEARQVLEMLTRGMSWSRRGTSSSRVTEEAQAALERLKRTGQR